MILNNGVLGILKETFSLPSRFLNKQTIAALLVTAAPLLFVPGQSVLAAALEDITEARDIIERMTEANRQLHYSGIFTYEHAGVLKTIKVVHAINSAGMETETLEHLSGPAREIVRQGHSLDCDYGGAFQDYYDVYMRGKDRIAGRQVRVVHLVPKDAHRYGYVLGVDKETGLLLQSMLVGSNRRVLERFQFVQIQVHEPGELTDPVSEESESAGEAGFSESNAPGSNTAESNAIRHAKECLDNGESLTPTRWRLDWLPPGFTLVGQQQAANQDRGGSTETLFYTDGLSQFSVFIDGLNADDLPQVQAQRGATVAHLTRFSLNGRSYSVSVVGEIPPETARLVAESVGVASAEENLSSEAVGNQ